MNRNHKETIETAKTLGIGLYISVSVSMIVIMLFGMILVNILPPYSAMQFANKQNSMHYHQNLTEDTHHEYPKIEMPNIS